MYLDFHIFAILPRILVCSILLHLTTKYETFQLVGLDMAPCILLKRTYVCKYHVPETRFSNRDILNNGQILIVILTQLHVNLSYPRTPGKQKPAML